MEILKLETCVELSQRYTFNESCDKYYNVIGDAGLPKECRLATEDENYWVCPAPTIGQTLKWLREVHEVFVCATFNGKWGWDAFAAESEPPHDYYLANGCEPRYDTYEEAMTEAIGEMIDIVR